MKYTLQMIGIVSLSLIIVILMFRALQNSKTGYYLAVPLGFSWAGIIALLIFIMFVERRRFFK